MRRPTAFLLSCLLLLLAAGAGPAAAAEQRPAPTLKELEGELTGIEKELTALQQKVDVLLQDLVDPRITTISVFFTAESKERLPLVLEVLLNGRPLATREFSETDRLVLLKGGSLEIHTGIVDPRPQTLTLRATVASRPGEAGGDMVAASFSVEPVRAAQNFVEVTVAKGPDPKTQPLALTAKTWTRD